MGVWIVAVFEVDYEVRVVAIVEVGQRTVAAVAGMKVAVVVHSVVDCEVKMVEKHIADVDMTACIGARTFDRGPQAV